MPTRLDVAGLARTAGLADQPLALAAHGPDGLLVAHVQGRWTGGRPVSLADRFYGASLTKQLTGTAIALLVRRGALDVDAPVGRYLLDLPAWRDEVSLRHLLHHTAGLPGASAIRAGETDWTNGRAAAHLASLDRLHAPPGAAEDYSNLGYVCLGAVIEVISRQSFAAFIAAHLTGPLLLRDMEVWESRAAPPFPQRLGMGPSLPLSTGDGGLWTTAGAFVSWLDAQNRDRLGVADLVQQPGQLADGRATDYGWGIGLRSFRGHRLFIHGGSWTGSANKAVRCPALGLSVVALSTGNADGVNALVDAVLAALADV